MHEALDIIRRAFTEDRFSFNGAYHIAVHDVAQHGILEYGFGGGMLLEKFEQLVVLEDASASIDMLCLPKTQTRT